MRRCGVAVALVLALPLVIAARDPGGDVAPCETGSIGPSPPDLVSVDATAEELGTAAVWRLTFAEPIEVADPGAAPMQIDILVRDPKIPAASVGDERGVNRIVRWVASSADRPIAVRWIPEHSQTLFNPPVIEGNTVELRVPGRILLGESANGTESVQRLRWSVLVRDGSACDRLGGRPALRLASETSTSSPAAPAASTSIEPAQASRSKRRFLVAGVVIAFALLGLWALRRFAPG